MPELQTQATPKDNPLFGAVWMATNRLERRRFESAVGTGMLTPGPKTGPSGVEALDRPHSRPGAGPVRAVGLSEFERDWRAGRIGEWVGV